MKLWLDDQIHDPATPNRHPPAGWVGVDNALTACRLLAKGGVTHISLDHDLGNNKLTGYIVALFIEKKAYQSSLASLTWAVHSANPIGAANIRRALNNANRYWRNKP